MLLSPDLASHCPHVFDGTCKMEGMQRIGEPRASLTWDSWRETAIMLNLSSRNGQINISVFTPVVQSSQMCKQGREPIRECDKQSHPSALCIGVTTLRGCRSRWCTVGTQESPSVFHSVGQRGHSRAHSPKLVTGRKRGTEEVTGCMTESVPGEVWDNPKNQHQCDGSSARPWNHRATLWPWNLLDFQASSRPQAFYNYWTPALILHGKKNEYKRCWVMSSERPKRKKKSQRKKC